MSSNDESDLLHGYSAIGKFLGMTPRQAQSHVEAGRLTVIKLGRKVCARRSTLTTWLADLEAAAMKERNND